MRRWHERLITWWTTCYRLLINSTRWLTSDAKRTSKSKPLRTTADYRLFLSIFTLAFVLYLPTGWIVIAKFETIDLFRHSLSLILFYRVYRTLYFVSYWHYYCTYNCNGPTWCFVMFHFPFEFHTQKNHLCFFFLFCESFFKILSPIHFTHICHECTHFFVIIAKGYKKKSRYWFKKK